MTTEKEPKPRRRLRVDPWAAGALGLTAALTLLPNTGGLFSSGSKAPATESSASPTQSGDCLQPIDTKQSLADFRRRYALIGRQTVALLTPGKQLPTSGRPTAEPGETFYPFLVGTLTYSRLTGDRKTDTVTAFATLAGSRSITVTYSVGAKNSDTTARRFAHNATTATAVAADLAERSQPTRIVVDSADNNVDPLTVTNPKLGGCGDQVAEVEQLQGAKAVNNSLFPLTGTGLSN